MRRSFVLTLIATLALATSAGAGEVEDRQAAIGRIELERKSLATAVLGLEQTYQKKLAEVERQRKSRAWNAKTRREEAQADAQQWAKRLEERQAKIKDADQRLLGERRALVAAIDRELATRPGEARRKRLEALRTSEQQKISVPLKKLRVPDEKIDPLDDPEDLDEKAARLRKAEAELLAALQRAGERATHLKRQALMAKAASRSRDPFPDAQKGNRTSQSHSESAGSRTDDFANGGGNSPTADPAQPPPTGPGEAGFTDGTAATGATPTDPNTTVSPAGSAVDLVILYSDVVDQSTIDALRSAERSSDPAVRAQAAERLAAALKARAERVKQQRQAIERRAKQLRGH